MGALGSGSVKVMLGRAAAMGIGFACAPIFGRMFNPAECGVATLVESMVVWIAGFASLGYAQAIPLAADKGEVRGLTRLSFLLNCGLLALLCLLALLFLLVPICGTSVGRWFGKPELARFIWFVPVLFLLSTLSDTSHYVYSQQGRFGGLSVLVLAGTGLAKPLQIALGWFFGGTSLMLLMGASLSGVLAVALAGIVIVPLLFGASKGGMSMGAVARRHQQFPRVQLWNTVLQSTSSSVPMLLIGVLFDSTVVGLFGMARKLVMLPVSLLAMSLGAVFYPEAAAEWRRDGSARDSIMGTFRILSMLSVFPTVCLCLLGPLLFSVFLGEKWFEAGVYAQLLAPYVMVLVFTGPMKWLFLIGNRAGRYFAYNVAAVVGKPLAVLGGAWYASGAPALWHALGAAGPVWLDGPRVAVFLYALAGSLVEGGLLLDAVRLGGVRPAEVAGVVMREVAVSAALLLPAAIVFWAGGPPVPALALASLGAVAQFVVLYRREEAVRRWTWRAVSLVRRGSVTG